MTNPAPLVDFHQDLTSPWPHLLVEEQEAVFPGLVWPPPHFAPLANCPPPLVDFPPPLANCPPRLVDVPPRLGFSLKKKKSLRKGKSH